MVLLDRQQDVRRPTPEAEQPRPFWVRQGFWALVVLTVVIGAIVLFVINANDPAPIVNEPTTVYEMLPEYGVDTLANAAVLAKAGTTATAIERYAGQDANLDPDTPAWWMPEYGIDTLANAAVTAKAGTTATAIERYAGQDANLDPDAPAWWMPEYEVDSPAANATFVPFHRYAGSSAAELDPNQ